MVPARRSTVHQGDLDSSADSAVDSQFLSIEPAQIYLRRRLLRLPVDEAQLAAWLDFYTSCDQCIRRFAISLSMRSHEFDECVQDVWVAVVRRLPGWCYKRTYGNFRTWLYRIVRNKAADCLRRRMRLPAQPLRTTRWVKSPLLELDPVAEYERKSDHEVVHAILALLRERIPRLSYRVFYLRRIEERSVAAVAELVGLSPQQVRARQCRTEQQFRKLCRKMTEI